MTQLSTSPAFFSPAATSTKLLRVLVMLPLLALPVAGLAASSAAASSSSSGSSTQPADSNGGIVDDGTPVYTTKKTASGTTETKTVNEDGGYISETYNPSSSSSTGSSSSGHGSGSRSAARYKTSAPNIYTVKSGDTLWGIASRYLDNPWRWKEIWVENRQIRNPNLIYPNQKLLMCDTPSGRRVGVDEGDGCTGLRMRAASKLAGGPRIIIEKMTPFIPMVATAEIESWLADVKIATTDEILAAPYVLAARNRHIMMSAGDTVYVRGKNLKIGDSYGIFRKGERYTDPETKAVLGNELRQIGVGRVERLDEQVASLEITQTIGKEILEGDRLFPLEEPDLPPVFYPANPVNTPSGKIIRVLDTAGTASLNNIVVLNRGNRQNVKPGDIFVLYRKGETVRDEIGGQYLRMPYERAGAALVFRVFKDLSYALILDSSMEVKTGDEVRAPNADE